MEISGSLTQEKAGAAQRKLESDLAIAKKLETSFLSEMLSYVGLDDVSETFGGGVGQQHFQSFLREQYAVLLVERGGVGLTEYFLQSLKD